MSETNITSSSSSSSIHHHHFSPLADGLIFPQKSILGTLLLKSRKKKLHRLSSEEVHFPDFIRVRVGSRRALEEWAKASGPGSFTLWAELAEECMKFHSPDITSRRILKSQLCFAYRLRSFMPLIQPIFPGLFVVVSPEVETLDGSPSPSPSSYSLRMENVDGQTVENPKVCEKWHSLRQKEKEKFLKSVGVNPLGNDLLGRKHGNGSSISCKWIQKWLLALPSMFYEKLVDMISPGGVLWHFQQLVQKVVYNSLFIDMRFEFIDFGRWLKHHSYAAALDGSRFLVCLSTLQWTIVKFDFSDNALWIIGDKCLESLLKNITDDSGSSYDLSHEYGKNKNHCPQVMSKWKVCQLSERTENSDCATLLNVMYDKGGFSEQEAVASFKQDFSFLGAFKMESISLAPRIQELKFCSLSGKNPGLSSKERCALSNLGSSSRSVRQRGIHILLDILMQDAKETFPSSRSDSRMELSNRKGGILTPLSIKSLCSTYSIEGNGSTSTSGNLSSNESCRAGRDSTRQHVKGSLMPQNAYQHVASPCRSFSKQNKEIKHEFQDSLLDCEILKAHLLPNKGSGDESENIGILKFFDSLCPTSSKSGAPFEDNTCKVESIQMRLLEWVHNGFLESLIEEAIESSGKYILRGETAGLSIYETAEICLNTTHVLPADATNHIVDSLMGRLKDYTTENGLLNFPSSGEIKLRTPQVDSSDQNLESELEKFWCLTKLLVLLVNGSIFIASGIAKCGGLWPIIELYASLVRIRISNQFECSINNDICMTLPGEVMEQGKENLIVSPLSTKHRFGAGHLPSESVCNITIHSSKHEILKERGYKMLEGSFARLVDLVTKVAFLCMGKGSSKFIFDQRKEKRHLSGRGLIENDHSEDCTTVQKVPQTDNINVGNVGQNVMRHSSERPKVPKLILKPCLTAEKSRRFRRTNHGFHIMVLETNICLLEVFHTLLVHHSAAAVSAQWEVTRKIHVNHATIISSFIMDMCNFIDSTSQPDERRLQELIFQVIYQLDRVLTQMNTDKHGHIHTDKDQGLENVTKAEKSLQADVNISFHERFLQEALRNLRVALSSDILSLESNAVSGLIEKCNHKLGSQKNVDVGRISTLSFWQRISMLMSIVADFSIFLSTEGLACSILPDICGYFDGALSVFSGLEKPATWSLPQILAMQSFLNLLKASFQIIKDDKSYSSSLWTDFEERLWQIIVRKRKHWACMKSYLSWLLLESCHGCYKNILNFSRFYADMPQALTILLFSKRDFCLESPGLGFLRDAFQCLDSLVILFYRRMQSKASNFNDNVSFFSSEDMDFLLDFLMNPVDGLLMNILKGPFFQGRMIRTEREIERETAGCTITCEDQISLLRGRRDHDVSPSLKLSSARQSAARVCELNGNSQVLTEDDRSIKTSPHCRYGTSPIRSWSWQTPYLFKLLKQLTSDLTCSQTFPNIESSCHSVHSHSDSGRCLCKSCTARIIVQGLASRISMLIEEECLNLLVKVFSLKFPECTVKPETASESPFLKQSYVDAFLDYHFLCFLQLYNWKVEGQLKKRSMNHSTANNIEVSEGNQSSYVQNEETLSIQESSSLADLCTTMFSEDETISIACRKHGEVLLALSQNKNGNVSRRFKQLKVMDFLVHQMALEYELSNVVTPRESSSENLLHAVLPPQQRTPNDFDSQNLLADNVLFHSERILTGDTSVSNAVESVEWVKHHTTNNDGSRLSQHYGNASNTNVENGKTKIYLPVPNCNRVRLKQKSIHCKDDTHQSGYSSCRTETSKKYSFPVSSRALSYRLAIQDHCRRSLKHEKHSTIPTVFPHSLKAFSDRCRTIRRKKLKENPVYSRVCKDYGYLDPRFNERSSLVFDDENISCNAASIVERKAERQDNSNVSKSSNKFVYCGRFCDLNEEVEKELAKEDASKIDCQKDEKRASLQRKLEMSNKKINGKLSEISPIIASNQQSNKMTPNTRRPMVPKLNLPKSARKGEEDLSSLRESVEEDLFLEKKKSQSHIQPDDENAINSEFNSGAIYSVDINRTVYLSYESERVKRRIYRDSRLHVLLLELFVSLMITPQGTLDTSYTDRFPMDGQRINAPFYLLYHINHTANAVLLPFLRQRMRNFSPSVCRIFKLVWRDHFDSSLYTNRHRIAHGASSQVYAATFTKMDGDRKICESVVLKTVDLPKGPYDPCKFFDIYSEVEILEKFIGDHRVCQLLDYGVDIESFILVLKHYKCSLRHWRQRHDIQFGRKEKDSSEKLSQAFYEKLPLYLEIYSAVLQAVKVLELHNVVHYDLKCDNILLEPLETMQSEEEFWNPVLSKIMESFCLPFRVCIADFGQSKASILQGGECTVRNRGTEYVKSPEMLMLLSTNKQDDNLMNFAEKDESVGRAVDVWGLGCLLYELLTGEYLLYDEDWTRFFIRVTLPSEELITDEKAAKLNNFKPIMEFLNFVLVRDPHRRPTLDAVIQKLEQLQRVLRKDGIGYSNLLNNVEDCNGMSDLNLEKKHTKLHTEVPDGKNQLGMHAGADISQIVSTDLMISEQHIDNTKQKEMCLCNSKIGSHSILPHPSPSWRTYITKLICGG